MATRKTASPAHGETFIKAEPGKPWPDPPAGGRWARDPITGDLTLIDATQDGRARSHRNAAAAAAPAAAPAAPAATPTKE